MEIVIRNAVDKGFHACHDDHDLNQIIRLMELQRFALLLGLDIGDAFGKALACAHFEIDFDGTFTETDAWTGGDGRTFSLGATWEMATQRLPVDISGSGTAPLTWRQFAFHSVDTLPGSSCTLTTTTDGTTTKNTTVSAQLEIDLGPRETPPPGQPRTAAARRLPAAPAITGRLRPRELPPPEQRLQQQRLGLHRLQLDHRARRLPQRAR